MSQLDLHAKLTTALIDRLQAGNLDAVDLDKHVLVMKELKDQINAQVNVAKLKVLHPQAYQSLVNRNVVSEDNYLADPSGHDPEREKIKCPAMADEYISRGECLDLSGATDCPEECSSCSQFSITRKNILG